MTSSELKSRLNRLLRIDSPSAIVSFLLKDNNGYLIKKADILMNDVGGIVSSTREQLQNLVCQMDDNDDFQVKNLSDADDRKNVIYKYDLNEKPDFFQAFDEITEHQNNYFTRDNNRIFDFNEDSLDKVDGYFILFGLDNDYILTYRKNFSVNLFKRNKIYLVKKDRTQFTTMKDDFLRVDAKIDLFMLDGIYIQNVDSLEKFYEFHQIISKEAKESIDIIEQLDIVDNLDVLRERTDELSFARKLTKISTHSPVFTLKKEIIIDFARKHPFLSKSFRFSGDGKHILLDTKKSQDFFIKLLNDDFLHSELTDSQYVTPSKDRIEY